MAGATGAPERCARRCRSDSSSVPAETARARVRSCGPFSARLYVLSTGARRRSLEPLGAAGCRRGGAQHAAKGLHSGHLQPRVYNPLRRLARAARARTAAVAPLLRGGSPMSFLSSERAALSFQLMLARRCERSDGCCARRALPDNRRWSRSACASRGVHCRRPWAARRQGCFAATGADACLVSSALLPI
jgi:hypothetical protein